MHANDALRVPKEEEQVKDGSKLCRPLTGDQRINREFKWLINSAIGGNLVLFISLNTMARQPEIAMVRTAQINTG